VLRLVLVAVLFVTALVAHGSTAAQPAAKKVNGFTANTGNYTVVFKRSTGKISITPKGSSASLAITELSGKKQLNLLTSTKAITHSGEVWTLTGQAPWAKFRLTVTLPASTPGEVHFALMLNPRKDPPALFLSPDVQLVHAPASKLKVWAPAPPVAGSSLFLSSTALNSSFLYFANLTSLGTYFDRTRSGGAQSNFAYPRAGTEGGLVGSQGGSFGYEPPPTSLGNLPHGKWTPVIDSYLYLLPGVPADETSMADTYLKLLGTVYSALPSVALQTADWKSLATKSAADLLDPSNVVTLNGTRYLRSYVSDNRPSAELITQAGVLAGVKAFEARYKVTLPLDAFLENNLPSFYDPEFHTVRNGLGHDPAAREESWYYVGNLISLLQAAQSGSAVAKKLLLDSANSAISLAHVNGYEFPQNFDLQDLSGKGTGVQPDVAGGYAWLMLGLYDMTGETKYLDEAKTSIAHVAGKGFDLTYESHMTAYTAAAGERLFVMTHDQKYRGYALLALANFFHATRLWDCTYGWCRKGAGYHTLFGVNILPWGDYVAMLEQYEAWLGLRDYVKYAQDEPPYVDVLVKGFLSATPAILPFSLPPLLPAGDVPTSPGLYSFVSHNHLDWNIPVEDLREGESQSGAIGQEIYGAGGSFMLGAYAP
jgi:hypothetical protein